MTNLNFRVSSALKDIIGRDLITDDNIAIFELVKNSYDAHARRVDVIFNNIYDAKKSNIIIKDNGKGMDYSDIKDKWLFVAYSAKKEGSEDKDYRDKIYQKRQFAGAKGIGRFSCDRLGRKLRLESTKIGERTQILLTDWEAFEKSMKEEFMEVEVSHTYQMQNSYGLKHGTILEISDLRSTWDKNKLDGLKDSLAKLINPSRNKKEKEFEIFVTCEEVGINEEKIENFIFETLEIKTSKIDVEISEDGKIITTELKDGGTLIYKITEKNNFAPFLSNIAVRVFYLNQSAKLTFSHRMGVNTKEYGSIFLYKNDVRIYPYGEPGEDPLKLDLRKAQKPSIYIGNKDVVGRIEILGTNPEFKETSSRGDGFQKNETYEKFLSFLEEKVIERLEKYVIDVQKWGDGNFLSVEDDLDIASQDELKTKITDLIAKLTNSDQIIDVKYDADFINIINESQSDSATSLVKNLFRLAKSTGNDQLLDVANRTEKRVAELHAAYIEANTVALKVTKQLEEKASENLFLKSIKSQDLDDVLNLMHHVGISTSTIQNYIKGIVYRIDNNIEIDKVELKKVLGNINMEVNKIYSISRFATKANFKVNSKATKMDLTNFVHEYILNIAKPFLSSSTKLSFDLKNVSAFVTEFKPLEITILIDNLINNSKKAKAKNIKIWFEKGQSNNLELHFEDDGVGVPKDIQDKIFDYGFTTTDGSGLGLTHVKEIVENTGGQIELNKKNSTGTEFILTFKK